MTLLGGKTIQGPSERGAADAGAGIAHTFFRLRLVMSLLVTLVIGRQVVTAYRQHAEAGRAAVAEGAAREVGALLVLAGRERGLVALSINLPPDRARDAAILTLRSDVDRAVAYALKEAGTVALSSDSTPLAKVIGGAELQRRAVEAERAALATLASGEAHAEETERWIETATRFNEALLALHIELLELGSARSPPLRELARLRDLTLQVAEHAGQERAIIGAALARSSVASPALLHELELCRGVVEHSLKAFDVFLASRSPPEDVVVASARMRRAFLEELEDVRAQAYRCVTVEQPCPLTAQQWFVRATAGIDTVVAVTDIVSEHAADQIARTRRVEELTFFGTLFAGALALALIAFASGFVRRRIIDRLQLLRDAAVRVADGALEQRVVVAGTDEIGAVAGAVEHMRGTLSSQNTSQRELIDRLTQTQSQLIQQERMASVGQLAGGVAHEINNPLAIILGNVVHLIDTLEDTKATSPFDTKEALEVLREIRQATERTSNIVRDLRDFAAIKPGAASSVDSLDDAVRSATNALVASFPAEVRLVLALDAPLAVAVPRSAIAQLLQRLLDNARDACSQGGTVTVRTSSDGDRAILRVEDDGCGIPAEHLGRIMEPFFTTKQIGAGTGLGLSVCLGIVRQLGGDMSIESTPGKGTIVTVKLPRAAAG